MSRRFWVLVGLGIVGLGTLGMVGSRWLMAPRPTIEETAPDSASSEPRLVLSPEKLQVAGIRTSEVRRRPVQQVRSVPGHIGYNGARRVDLRSPVEAVVQTVYVKPGDRVAAGARLAALESAEVGLARADLEKAEQEVLVAENASRFADETQSNLDSLIARLETRPAPQAVEQEFEGRTLGDFRTSVLAAYSRLVLAERLWTDIQPLVEKGSVSQTVVRQRETAREIAQSEFSGVCEQSRFSARQVREKAHIALDYASRLRDVCRQRLKTLLGAFTEVDAAAALEPQAGPDLTRFYLVAPFEGTVEQRAVAAAQRVSPGSPLFMVANIESLWVTAEIRERDWPALKLAAGDEITARVPALNNRSLTARVEYVGTAVSDDSQAVPLTAVISNSERMLRPGQFVWVDLPIQSARDELVVPASALLSHEGQKFVFVEEGERTFRRVDITTSLETNQWVAVTEGLKADQKVVDSGAFLLKSELLLEAEED